MIKVRIQNFQSIEDAEVEIDGFTVITGPNNSGKSALMRAIRGVFTNAPAGPLVRHGAKHLSVGLAFPDGSTVLWEKGSKLNRYTVNGKELSSVGRGVPPEVSALGIQEVKAASDRLWPQIAEQFTGSLFLVNRPGSVVAEALSDVDRVGTLTEALRLSESDRRSCASELKIRRKDLHTHQEQAATYEGLDEVLKAVSDWEDRQQELTRDESELTALSALAFQWQRALKESKHFAGFDAKVVPAASLADSTVRLRNDLSEVLVLASRHKTAADETTRTEGFPSAHQKLQGTTAQKVVELQEQFDSLSDLNTRWKTALGSAQKYETDIPEIPLVDGAEKLRRAIEIVCKYEENAKEAADSVAALDIRLEELHIQTTAARVEVDILLGSRGVCPTCNTVCVMQHAVGGEA